VSQGCQCYDSAITAASGCRMLGVPILHPHQASCMASTTCKRVGSGPCGAAAVDKALPLVPLRALAASMYSRSMSRTTSCSCSLRCIQMGEQHCQGAAAAENSTRMPGGCGFHGGICLQQHKIPGSMLHQGASAHLYNKQCLQGNRLQVHAFGPVPQHAAVLCAVATH